MVIEVKKLDSELEEKFRKIASKKFGQGKFHISKALEEALEYYVYNQLGFLEWQKFRKIMKRESSPI